MTRDRTRRSALQQNMNQPTILSIHTGRIAPLGPDGVTSAIVKPLAAGPAQVKALGIVGDEQADLSVHGGPDKAVYGYGADHYASWQKEFPRQAALFVPGGVGENLAIAGMTESDLCVGDIHAIGTALLQACQPRQPCHKFALLFGNNQLPKAMVRNGRSGWYYRVLREGVVTAGDEVKLHERPNPEFPFSRLVKLVSFGGASEDELRRMSEMKGLAVQWQQQAKEALGKS